MTPRRILLLMGGLFAFGVVYTLYARLFGWLDGLPMLPARMLIPSSGEFRPPPRATSPTIERLKEAFGEDSPETEPAFYPTQLEFRNGDSSIVLAAGSPPSTPNSNRVTLKPFSVAIFSKPRPQHLLGPGEVNEISTFHSDLAVLEFDRVIKTATEMNSAKLVRLELISDPEQALPDRLGRRGLVHITNNQRSGDPNRYLVLKTVGPVFYRDPKYATGPALLGPDVWTDSPVEIVDRSNLPRRPGTAAAVAPGAADVFRNPAAVAEVLRGQRLPPPTITAVGMRIYLEPDDPPTKPAAKTPAPKSAKKGSAGFSGVRRAELLEKVVMNLWIEGGQALVGAGGQSAVIPDLPAAAMGIGGGLLPAAHAAREFARDLLQVETRGPFNYDAEKNIARFDVVPQSDPNLPNDVRVTKVAPRPGTQVLFSQVLEIEFNGPPTGGQSAKSTTNQPAARVAAKQTATATPAPQFKRLHAWTYTPGRFLTVSSDADQLEAYGQDLVREQVGERTTLTGAPLYAVQERNVLTAGTAKNPGVLILEPPPGVPPGPDRKSQATVRGPGRVDLFDATTGTSTTSASWQTSMVQTRERSNGRDVDLFTFTDGARFEDTQADYWLKGHVLKLWLAPPQPGAVEEAGETVRSRPHRVQALGNVTAHSLDMDVEQADQLNAWFKDVPPPEPIGLAPTALSPNSNSIPRQPAASPKEPRQRVEPRAAPQPMPGVAAVNPSNPAPKEKAKDAEKPKPPMKLKARSIDTWVVRYPIPKLEDATPIAPGTSTPKGNNDRGARLKYQLESAQCEGMVNVHQDPDDPAKPRGTDILGSKMLIDSTAEGSILTVFGWETRPAEVHNEGTSLIGPKVVVDQLHNLANIEGRGSVALVTATDFTGAELRQPEVVVVQFRDGMIFKGAQKTADFFGKVNATQGASWVVCHTMQVIFDRPVYFSQMNRPASPKAGTKPNEKPADDKAKIDMIYCYPAPADSADSPQEKLVSFQQVERDPQTGKPIRQQKLVARELTLRAQVRDEGTAEPYKLVLADGPGVVRTWQPGTRDDAVSTNPGTAPLSKQPGNIAPPPPEMEMKLTVVTFSGRMIAKDKGKLYQDATFHENIQVIHLPTDNPDLVVERHRLPPQAVLLTCTEKLIVWTHKKGTEPPVQHMEAYGNAYLQNEEYDGWGEVVTYDGKVIVFDDGSGFERRVTNPIPARIKSRFKGNDNSGRRIIFDRATNHYQVIDSVGGTITSYPSANPPPKKSPSPPKK